MNSFKIEDHNSVALLKRLRDGLMMPNSRQRKVVFNGVRDALRGLGLISAKDPIIGLYEGIDAQGGHWFMAELKEGMTVEQPVHSVSRSTDDFSKLATQLAKVAHQLVVEGNWRKEILKEEFLKVIVSRLPSFIDNTALHNLTLAASAVLDKTSDRWIDEELRFQVTCAKQALGWEEHYNATLRRKPRVDGHCPSHAQGDMQQEEGEATEKAQAAAKEEMNAGGPPKAP